MVGFAYRDKYGILHVVASEKTAKESSGDGKYRTYHGRFEKGYPTIGGQAIKDKKGEETYISGGDNRNKDIPLSKADPVLRREVKLILEEIGL
jgi:hypothetical protein